MKDYVTIRQAADLIGCSEMTIYRWLRKGYIEYEAKMVGLKKIYQIYKPSLLKYWEIRKKDIE